MSDRQNLIIALLFEINKSLAWNREFRRIDLDLPNVGIVKTLDARQDCHYNMESLVAELDIPLKVPDLTQSPDDHEQALYDFCLYLYNCTGGEEE